MSNFYCAAPWRGLHINARGNVKTCCAGNPNMLGNLYSQSIEQILNGPVLQEIRQSLRQGQPHDQYCKNCIERESKSGDSERSWHNRINEQFDPSQAGLNYEYPALIDVRWNTTCNLSCNYCDAGQSSKWASIVKKPVDHNNNIQLKERIIANKEHKQERILKREGIDQQNIIIGKRNR